MAFRSVWRKIERAKEHSDALDAHLKLVFSVDENLPILGTKAELNAGGEGVHRNIVYVSYARDLSSELERAGILLGDAVHNLRSALDHLAYRLALNHRGQLTEKQARSVYFPICIDQIGWPGERKRKLRYVAAKDRGIIERYQPFKGKLDNITLSKTPADFHPLSVLEELDLIDKHRLIPTVLMDAGGFRGDTFNMTILLGMMAGSFADRVIPAVEGAEVASWLARGDPVPDVEQQCAVAPNVALENGTPIQPMLERIAAVVVKIVREFDPVV